MIESPDQMRRMLTDCTVASLHEFRKDLERRIAIVFKFQKQFPERVVVNMAETISKELGEFFDGIVLQPEGPLDRALDKLL